MPNTRSPACWLLTKMVKSSAYRANWRPLLSNSLSRGSSMIFDSNGESGPPFGTPTRLSWKCWLSTTSALRYRLINRSTRLSWTLRPSKDLSKSWSTRSMNLDRSTSNAKRRPALMMEWTCLTACFALRRGLLAASFV